MDQNSGLSSVSLCCYCTRDTEHSVVSCMKEREEQMTGESRVVLAVVLDAG